MPLRRQLRSSCSDLLHVLLVRLSTVGSRTFPVSDVVVRNDLPAHVASLAVFRQRLKTLSFDSQTMYFFIPARA